MKADIKGEVPVDGEACLIAAEQIQRKLMAIKRKVCEAQDATVKPNNPLPVDLFLTQMENRVNAPRIILRPRRLNDHLWTESVTAYIYGGIEQAFVKAGKLPGSNRAGHKRKLQKLKAWVEAQEKNPQPPALSREPEQRHASRCLLWA